MTWVLPFPRSCQVLTSVKCPECFWLGIFTHDHNVLCDLLYGSINTVQPGHSKAASLTARWTSHPIRMQLFQWRRVANGVAWSLSNHSRSCLYVRSCFHCGLTDFIHTQATLHHWKGCNLMIDVGGTIWKATSQTWNWDVLLETSLTCNLHMTFVKGGFFP